jgi:hypothetical protein
MRVLARNIVIFTLGALIFVYSSESIFRLEQQQGFNYANVLYVSNVLFSIMGVAVSGFMLLEIWHNAQVKLKLLEERFPESRTRSTTQSPQSG